MSVLTNTSIHVQNTPVKIIDLVQASSNREDVVPDAAASTSSELHLLRYDAAFSTLIGPQPTHALLLSSASTTQNPFFHAACVYIPGSEELYTTSNFLQPARSSQYPAILISRIKLHRTARLNGANDVHAVDWVKMRPPPGIDMPRGAVNYGDVTSNGGSILFCAQGAARSVSGGLYHMPRLGAPVPLVTAFHGRDFNSISDAVTAGDGSIWFTDPPYGFENDIRPRPKLPPHLYRYHPTNGDLRVLANDLARPTGLAFSPDQTVLFVTDADDNSSVKSERTGSIYAYDVCTASGSPFLANKRLFAYPASGRPEGIKCDIHGNVYVGCGAGVEIYSPGGSLIGSIMVPSGVTRFCFGREGELFLCAEKDLWRLQLARDTQGALLGI